MVAISRVVVRTGVGLDAPIAEQFNGTLLPGETVVAVEVVEPAEQLPCLFDCIKRAMLREGAAMDSAELGHIEIDESVTVTERGRNAEGQVRLRLGKRGWTRCRSVPPSHHMF